MFSTTWLDDLSIAFQSRYEWPFDLSISSTDESTIGWIDGWSYNFDKNFIWFGLRNLMFLIGWKLSKSFDNEGFLGFVLHLFKSIFLIRLILKFPI